MKTVKCEAGVNSAELVTIVDDSSSHFAVEYSQESASFDDSVSYFCPSCMKGFDEKQLLTRHLKIHTQTGPFPCDYCSDELDDRYSLRAHWRTYHASDGCHMCNTCGESFDTKDSLLNHQDIHEKAKRHRCVECGKAFSYKSDLRKHMIIHSGIRPYVCPICSKTFTRSTNLNKHQRLHSGLRPFVCSQCPKTFSCKGDLGRHQIIHTGVKPYRCSVCTLSFSRKDKLTKHERMHDAGVPLAFTCPCCPATFTRKEELTKHTQFSHFSPSSCLPSMDGLLMYVSELVDDRNKQIDISSHTSIREKNPNDISTSEEQKVVIEPNSCDRKPLHISTSSSTG